MRNWCVYIQTIVQSNMVRHLTSNNIYIKGNYALTLNFATMVLEYTGLLCEALVTIYIHVYNIKHNEIRSGLWNMCNGAG